jgi:hypothetical protein
LSVEKSDYGDQTESRHGRRRPRSRKFPITTSLGRRVIHIRQSALARLDLESTDRQYNLMNKALSLGRKSERIFGSSIAISANLVDLRSKSLSWV